LLICFGTTSSVCESTHTLMQCPLFSVIPHLHNESGLTSDRRALKVIKHTSSSHPASSICDWRMQDVCSTSYAIAIYKLEPAWRVLDVCFVCAHHPRDPELSLKTSAAKDIVFFCNIDDKNMYWAHEGYLTRYSYAVHCTASMARLFSVCRPSGCHICIVAKRCEIRPTGCNWSLIGLESRIRRFRWDKKITDLG